MFLTPIEDMLILSRVDVFTSQQVEHEAKTANLMVSDAQKNGPGELKTKTKAVPGSICSMSEGDDMDGHTE